MEVKALLTLDSPNPGCSKVDKVVFGARTASLPRVPGCPGSWWDVKAPETAAGAEPTPSIVLRSPSPTGCPVDSVTALHPQPWASALWILGAAEGAEKARDPVPAGTSLPCGDSFTQADFLSVSKGCWVLGGGPVRTGGLEGREEAGNELKSFPRSWA